MKNHLKIWLIHWMKLFSLLRRKKNHDVIVGVAILKKDEIRGKKYWVSWSVDDGEFHNRVDFDVDVPLIFPPKEVQIGTKVQLLNPGK